MLQVVWNATGPQRWHDQLNFALVSEAYGGIHMLLGVLSSPQKQTILPTIVCKCSAECTIVITKLISFVARDLCLLSIVCGDGLRQLLNTTEPGYRLPSAFGGAASKARPTYDNKYLDQPCYTGIPYHHSPLHYSRVEDGKCNVANLGDA